jgi:ABC-type transporter Mla subunit MlaD
MNFRSLQNIGVLLASDDRKNLQELTSDIDGVSYDIDTTIATIGRLLAAADPAKVGDCLGEVGKLLEGLANLRLRVTGDLGEFQLMTS